MSSKRLTVAAVPGAVVALVLPFALGSAEATRTVNIASHVSIKSKELTFSGKVTSSRAPCLAGRKVTLYRKPAQVLGSTTTSSSGKWKITASGSAGISLGRFYAKVKRLSQGTAGTIYVCSAARSKTIRMS
ncbi:MAG: hypothetical protein ACYDA6_10630 [Solirubrobacteraceae bacterium]